MCVIPSLEGWLHVSLLQHEEKAALSKEKSGPGCFAETSLELVAHSFLVVLSCS